MTQFERTRILVGENGVAALRKASVAVFGLGGVGGYAFEALVRAGAGTIYVVDFDTVDLTNLNRQILATHKTLSRNIFFFKQKTAYEINPEALVVPIFERVTPNTVGDMVSTPFDYAIDAIDSLKDKLALLAELHRKQKRFVSCLGAARRLDPTAIRIADISKTFACPLARRVRLGLRKMGITRGVLCVFSSEPPVDASFEETPDHDNGSSKKRPQGSLSFVPGLIGLTAAGLIINSILGKE